MKIANKSDFPATDAGCKKATGRALKQWFKELDKIDGLKQGRRVSTQHIYTQAMDRKHCHHARPVKNGANLRRNDLKPTHYHSSRQAGRLRADQASAWRTTGIRRS